MHQDKLVPSLYGACKIDNQIKYTGPTYATIRSLKHNKINAEVHASDFKDLLLLDPFIDMICDPTGQLKPIGAFSVDGGPDQNPRFPATVNAAVHHFKKHNLDASFIMTNAPGHSAYNPIELRMAPISHDVTGLVLRHDYYGSHLNEREKIIDVDL